MQAEVVKVNWKQPEIDEKAIDVEAALRTCRVANYPDSTGMVGPLGRRKVGIQERLDSQVGHRAVLCQEEQSTD